MTKVLHCINSFITCSNKLVFSKQIASFRGRPFNIQVGVGFLHRNYYFFLRSTTNQIICVHALRNHAQSFYFFLHFVHISMGHIVNNFILFSLKFNNMLFFSMKIFFFIVQNNSTWVLNGWPLTFQIMLENWLIARSRFSFYYLKALSNWTN